MHLDEEQARLFLEGGTQVIGPDMKLDLAPEPASDSASYQAFDLASDQASDPVSGPMPGYVVVFYRGGSAWVRSVLSWKADLADSQGAARWRAARKVTAKWCRMYRMH